MVSDLPVSLAHPWALLLLFVAFAAIVVIWRRWPAPLRPRAARLALGIRLLIVLALVMATGGLQLLLVPVARTVIVIADRSASVQSSEATEVSAVTAMSKSLGTGNRLGVISVGRTAVVENPVTPAPQFSGFSADVNANYTDLQSGVRLANAVLPDDTAHQIVLMTDGHQNIGDVLDEVTRAHATGTRVDVLPVGDSSAPEVLVDSVSLPNSVPPGGKVHAQIVVSSSVAQSGTVHVTSDGAPLVDIPVNLAAGETDVETDLGPLGPGLHGIEATIDAPSDTLIQNNTGRAIVQVLGAQRVLVVEGHPGAGANMVAALQGASVSVSTTTPDAVPTSAYGIAAYQSIVLADVAASDLGTDRMTALQAAVRDLGVGLVTTGGPHTYGPGGWLGTPLEATVPIDMRITNDPAKPPVAVVLVLESVESQTGDATVRGAAAAVVSRLTPNDLVGVTDGATGMIVPLQPVGDGTQIAATLNNYQGFGDPFQYDPYMQIAGNALAAHPTASKHIILLGDGDAPQVSSALIHQLVGEGITISAVGVNIDQSPQQMASMKAVADQGGGRFYESSSPAQVPDILLKETNDQLRPWVVQQHFLPTVGSPSSLLNGLDLNHFPGLDGYVASTAKPAASVVFSGPYRDPILAEWQYGLGHVVSWTSDTAGQWTSALMQSSQGATLVANLVGGTFPLQADPALGVSSSVSGDSAQITVTLANAPAGARVTATVSDPSNASTMVVLASTDSGKYVGNFPADLVGDYVMRVTVNQGSATTHAATAGFAVPYSPEYRSLGVDKQFLAAIAKAGGGAVLDNGAAAMTKPITGARIPFSLAIPLLMLAALLFPFDVALRRLTLQSGDAKEWAELRKRRKQRLEAPVAEEATLGRLRSKVGGVRGDVARRVEESGPAVKPGSAGDTEPVSGDAAASPNAPAPADIDLATRLMERRRKK